MTGAATTDIKTAPGDWPLRPWVLAALLGIAGLLVHLASDGGNDVPWRMALTAFCFFGPIAAAFTIDRDDFFPPLIFAGIVGLVMAGIAWRATSAGDRYSDEEYWVAAGVLAITLALPLFQAGFHRLRWKTSYLETHFHVWTDAITGAGALAFVGLSWALIAILAALFEVIQINALDWLIDQEWFGWIFSGAAFGAALGVLRNQLKIIGTLQSVVLLVLSILAVPLALALVLFLLAVIFSGIDVLWEATKSATPLLLACGVGSFVLTNAVVRDEDEAMSGSRILRIAGFVLAIGILPLAIMAALSMGTRIAQHGLSPERIWALIAIAVAVAYGVGYFVSAIRGRKDGWRGFLRQTNLHLAVLTCAVAFLLAMPILNFGAISTNNQLARLQSGEVSVEDFDYAALRWDFGEPGREALAELVKSGNPRVVELAKAAEEMEYRYDRRTPSERRAILEKSKIEVADQRVNDAVADYIAGNRYLCLEGCRVVEIGAIETGPLLALIGNGDPKMLVFDPEENEIRELWIRFGELDEMRALEVPPAKPDANVEIRPFTGRQLYVDGKPASAPFE